MTPVPALIRWTSPGRSIEPAVIEVASFAGFADGDHGALQAAVLRSQYTRYNDSCQEVYWPLGIAPVPSLGGRGSRAVASRSNRAPPVRRTGASIQCRKPPLGRPQRHPTDTIPGGGAVGVQW